METDQLGTPRIAANSSTGAKEWEWSLLGSGFGEHTAVTHTVGKEVLLRNPGQRLDNETGLSYNYFRDYESAVGRYIQSDPIGLNGGINTYAYVSSSPLDRIDTLGLIEHVSGRWIDCDGGCRIRIDYTLDPTTNQKIRHLHWECNGDSGECGENGLPSHGGTWDDAPRKIRQCAMAAGFNGAFSNNNQSQEISITSPGNGNPNPGTESSGPPPWIVGISIIIVIIGGLTGAGA